jgi:hypothetical protein
MNRLALWICWAIVGALYQAAKLLFGLHPNWEAHFDMMYWTGWAFLALWLTERFHRSST